MRVAAFVPYQPGYCSGQKFRIELWAGALASRGVAVQFFPFTSDAVTDVLYKPGHHARKAALLLRAFTAQVRRALTAPRPDVVFIYREASLLGPALVERLTRRWKVPIIYDIDEPLFVPYVSPRNGRLNILKCASKTHTLFRMSDQVLAVNRAIADYAGRYNTRVSIVPMALDTDRFRPPQSVPEGDVLRIGWTGTRTTQPNLQEIAGPLAELGKRRAVRMRCIADEPMTLPGVETEFIRWERDLEIPRLQECHIGVVPVRPDSPWNPWKFFYKTIVFMSLGMPVVAADVGSNAEIIEDGVNGFLARTEEDWHDRLSRLADDPQLRRTMGAAARSTAERLFSIQDQIDQIEATFRTATRS
jgi:glycosyltransferase involved in cell wall biosynthesis